MAAPACAGVASQGSRVLHTSIKLTSVANSTLLANLFSLRDARGVDLSWPAAEAAVPRRLVAALAGVALLVNTSSGFQAQH